MPTTELFVVDSAGVTKRVSELSPWLYRYKKQKAAGNMDPSMPRVSVDATHPVVTAARRHSGKGATERETPPTRKSPPRLAKAILSATSRSAGLARSSASLARTGAASARSSMGSSSVSSGSNLNPLVGVADVAVPHLSDVSKEEDEDDDAIARR